MSNATLVRMYMLCSARLSRLHLCRSKNRCSLQMKRGSWSITPEHCCLHVGSLLLNCHHVLHTISLITPPQRSARTDRRENSERIVKYQCTNDHTSFSSPDCPSQSPDIHVLIQTITFSLAGICIRVCNQKFALFGHRHWSCAILSHFSRYSQFTARQRSSHARTLKCAYLYNVRFQVDDFVRLVQTRFNYGLMQSSERILSIVLGAKAGFLSFQLIRTSGLCVC